MSKSFICSLDEIDGLNIASSKIPIGLLDPNHPAIDEKIRKAILDDRFHKQLIADGIEIGRFTHINGKLHIKTGLSLASFTGLVLESYCVNEIRNNFYTIGKKAFKWVTNRQQVTEEYLGKHKVIGTGFVTTKDQYPYFYNPQHNLDIRFIKKNHEVDQYEPAIQNKTTLSSGIQVKAITDNEVSEIIDPILNGKYSHVLTLLYHNDGVHSYYKCMEFAHKLFLKDEISKPQKLKIEYAVKSPDRLGIDQRNINDYCRYISYWYAGRANTDVNLFNAVGLEIKGYKYNNGLLIPET